MTDKTHPHAGSTHIIRYALELGLLWIDGSGRDKVREALDALDALEAKLESTREGGVQALSAAPAGLVDAARMAMDALDWHATSDKTIPLWKRQQPALEALRAALAASPTPPAEQQAQPGAVYAELPEPTTHQIAELKACEHGDAIVGWRVEPSRQSFHASMHPKRTLYTTEQARNFADRTHALRVAAAPQAAPGEPVHGDVLPPVGSRVYIRHGRDNDAHACTVTGYYAWGDLGGDKRLHRVFVRLVYEGTDRQQARMLCDCYPTADAALAQAAPQQEAQEPYPIDADPQGIRAVVADAITGALAFGAQGSNPPPEGHWLTPFWEMAREEAMRTQPASVSSDTLYLLRRLLSNQHTLTGSEFRAELEKIVGEAYQQEAQEPFAWESTTPGYIKYITQAQYEKFRPNVRRWYKPYKCSNCSAPQPAPAPLSDDTKDAARYRWLRNKSTVLHGTAWLGSATAYQRDVDFLRRDDALAALDAAIDAAIAAQGGKV